MMSDSNINLPKQHMGKPSQPISAVSSGIQGASDQLLAAVEGVYCPPNTCYDYYYHGYNGPFSQSNDKGYFKTSAGSCMVWYPTVYTWIVGVDGKQAYTSPAGYLQQLCSYGSEAFPCYAYDLAYAETRSAAAATRSRSLRPVIASSGSGSRMLFLLIHNSNSMLRNPSVFTRYGNNTSKLPYEVKQQREYNLKEFRTEYDSAKFYVIKSYSEDDIHKCIKYDVWSSTLHGNKKLDAGLREAEAKGNQTGKRSPVFLFFSLDKWHGYFPVKWHIIKDVPNTLLRHIILKNNENRPVTYSRDTQEIGLEQGLEMLRIFKNYSEKTSVLDDFNFYEHRDDEAIKVKRNTKPASRTNRSKSSAYKKHFEGGEGMFGQQSAKINKLVPSSLTKNLSLSSPSRRTHCPDDHMILQQPQLTDHRSPSSLASSLKDPGLQLHNAHDDQQMKSAAAVDSDCRTGSILRHP
ncbi:UNVERIFIED_CONTAM: YTH domain-containing protein ECT3 [Sesamum latifolium]|uniref:YTH domain-containing family protein n=1 Tax=Sesamum latifolium TaxID=2727402 RepID=A0AAW2XLA4_9LAMI